jgi:uncharacterized protein YeaO (DUF488 family)
MSFLLRAALVIGGLSYCAMQREGAVSPTGELRAVAERQAAQLTAFAGSLPAEMRDAAAQAATAELMKRLSTQTASHDTLVAADRRPAWRGGENR